MEFGLDLLEADYFEKNCPDVAKGKSIIEKNNEQLEAIQYA